MKITKILSIAGSDSGGGAGIQADIKAISANRAYAASVITALTAQNTQGVQGVLSVEPDFIAAQLDSVLSDIEFDAIKIGMLGVEATIKQVATSLHQHVKAHAPIPIILDPVMVAKSGDSLLQDQAINSLIRDLIPMASIITPNLPEAAILTGQPCPRTVNEMESLIPSLLALGCPNILLKGGHLDGDQADDLWITSTGNHWLHQPRITVKHSHGTGCTLSAALATFIGHGHSPFEAASLAKHYLTKALQTADRLEIGKGIGPVDHFGLGAL
ncbi:MAG: bifunctional hydroxymethylpyrimidine kinase/phosphomethylpyrimidine kinase [Alphaproteobacteria bacterium]